MQCVACGRYLTAEGCAACQRLLMLWNQLDVQKLDAHGMQGEFMVHNCSQQWRCMPSCLRMSATSPGLSCRLLSTRLFAPV